MDSYGFEGKGPVLIQKVSSLPSWTSEDEGRLIYDQSIDGLYYGTSADWVLVSISSGIISGVKMYFYQNTAPVGWTIDISVSDALIGVKGGVNAFNVAGGNLAGTWSQAGHTHTTADHTLTVAQIPSHTHAVYYIPNLVGIGGGPQPTSGGSYFNSGATGGGGAHNHGSTASSGTANTYRPYAAVGIICTKS